MLDWSTTFGGSVMQEHDQPFDAAPFPPPPGMSAGMSGIPAVPAVDRTGLRDLASRQRAAIVAGIANAVGGALLFAHSVPEGTGALISLVVAAFVIVAAFRLAQRLHGVWIGVLCGVAMLIP